MPRKRLMAILAAVGVTVAGAAAAVLPMTASNAAEACAPAYSASAVYTQGNRVSYQGKNWTAKWWTQNEAPYTSQWGVWADNGACGGTTPPNPPTNPPNPPGNCNYPDWVYGVDYPAGTIIRYVPNGNYYRAKHQSDRTDPVISTWYWEPFACGGTNPPNPPTNPPAGGFPLTSQNFEDMFPNRNRFYTYAGLIDAARKYPAFAGTGSDEIRKREIAAFLANANHETGGLVYVTEINKGNDLCDESQPDGCPAGTYGYYGRGPIQLSWNFNYKMAGDALGLNLLGNPYLVEQDASVAWQTAIWYWMTQRGPGTMTPHDAIVNNRGFGETIRSINGALECNGGNPGQVQSRVTAFNNFTGILRVSPGANLYC